MIAEKNHPSLSTADLGHILAHTESLWGDLRNERIFFTGGTGFVGMWLLESFAWINEQMNLNASACILTRSPAKVAQRFPWLAGNAALNYHGGDATSFEFPQGTYSHVVHAATENDSTIHPLDATTHFTANIQATNRVLEFSRECGAQRIMFTSGGAIYGKQPETLSHLPEDFTGAPSPLNLQTAYGQSKRVSEFLCAAAGEKQAQTVTIARLFTFVGPYLKLDANFAIGNFLRDAMSGRSIAIEGDGTPHRSYLYAADMAIWLWTILLRGKNGRAYNVGSDQAVSIGQLAERVAKLVAPNTAITLGRQANPALLPTRYLPDITRATNELGLKVWVELDDAIVRTAQWHRILTHESI